MIASSAVARWAWGRDDETADALVCCLRDLLLAYGVMAVHGFAAGDSAVRVSVSEAGRTRKVLFEGDFTVPSGVVGPKDAVGLLGSMVDEVRAGLEAGEIGSVDAFVECSGTVVLDVDGGQSREEKLFRLGASSFADFVTVDLVTHADVWLPYDLKGRPQHEVYVVNGPRLSAVLHDLAEVLESETDPDDPTYFAKPTESGAENFFDTDGAASDVWGTFEVPSRYRVFAHAPGFGRIGYRRTAEGEVRYVAVRSEDARVLGFLWASDDENAASFEPRDVGDDATYRAGLVWLERLRAAHDRGLSPSAALAELSGLPDEQDAGRADRSGAGTLLLADLRRGRPLAD
ncbi:hypothetical protein [Streptomyces sp. NPDC088812]|uniref:hypothetical protein n=1 Tax=Streptomyces sp. NPDC088812 TaxID=3365905 RepID=UPI00381709ED